jgi:hypothetical protein
VFSFTDEKVFFERYKTGALWCKILRIKLIV